MSSDALFSAAHLLLPEVLVSHFDLTKHIVKEEEIHFYFTGLNKTPEEFKEFKLHSKGFFPEVSPFRVNASKKLLNFNECTI